MNSTITHYFSPQGASGEADGLPIVFREDGYINMTKAAKHFGKDLSNFWRLPATREYMDAMADAAYSTSNSVKITILEDGAYQFSESKKGRYGLHLLPPQAGSLLRSLAGCPLRCVV